MLRNACLRCTLLAVLAFSTGMANAQSSGGSSPRSMSPTSPNMTSPSMQGSSSGASMDMQDANPTMAECDRMMKDQSMGSGGAMNDDMKAKMQKCRQMKSGSMPPR